MKLGTATRHEAERSPRSASRRGPRLLLWLGLGAATTLVFLLLGASGASADTGDDDTAPFDGPVERLTGDLGRLTGGVTRPVTDAARPATDPVDDTVAAVADPVTDRVVEPVVRDVVKPVAKGVDEVLAEVGDTGPPPDADTPPTSPPTPPTSPPPSPPTSDDEVPVDVPDSEHERPAPARTAERDRTPDGPDSPGGTTAESGAGLTATDFSAAERSDAPVGTGSDAAPIVPDAPSGPSGSLAGSGSIAPAGSAGGAGAGGPVALLTDRAASSPSQNGLAALPGRDRARHQHHTRPDVSPG